MVDTPTRSDRQQLPTWFVRVSRYSWGFIGIAIALAILVAVLGLLRELVIPLILAAFFAIVLEPAVDWLTARKVPRSVAAAIMVLVVGAVVAGAFVIIVLGIAGQADEIAGRLTEAQSELKEFADQSDFGDFIDTIRENAASSGPVTGSGIGTRIGSLLGSAAGFVAGLLLGAILLYYLLKDGARMSRSFIADLRPEGGEQVARIFEHAASSVRSYFRGKTVLAFVQGIVIWVALAILDVPLAGSVGIVNFIGAYIPYLGAFLGGAYAVLMAISEGGLGLAFAALAIVLFTNLVVENLLEPKFLGASLNLNPIVVLLSTVAGGVVAGMVGLILAAPLTSIGINLYGELKSSGFFESDDDQRGVVAQTEP